MTNPPHAKNLRCNHWKLMRSTAALLVLMTLANAVVSGQETLDLGLDFDQIKLTSIGGVEQIDDDTAKYNLSVLRMDIFFKSACWGIMAKEMIDHVPPLRPVNYTGENRDALEALLAQDDAEMMTDEGRKRGSKRLLSKNLQHAMVFTNMEFGLKTSSDSVGLYYSYVPKVYRYQGFIGVSCIGRNLVNQVVFGMVELKERKNGDELSIYLELSETEWYYFSYKRGMLGAYSTNENFNECLRNSSPRKRTYKGKNGERDITYVLSTDIQRRNFVRTFRPNTN